MIVVGGWPGRVVVGLNGRFGVRPAAFAVGGDFVNPLADDADGGDANTEFVAVVASLPSSGTVTFGDDGGFTHTGAADGTYLTVFDLYAWAQGGPLTYYGQETVTTIFGTGSGGGTTFTITPATVASTATVGTPTFAFAVAGPSFVITPATVASTAVVGTPSFVFQADPDGPVPTFPAYATASLFVRKFGLAEAAQLLQDEERLLTPELLRAVIAGAWTGTPTADEKAAAREALERLNRELGSSSSVMDGYFRTVTNLPLSPDPAAASTLENCCLALTRYGLADDAENATDRIRESYETWRTWLKDIAARRVLLVQPDGQAQPVTPGVRGGKAKTRYNWDAFGGGKP